LLYAVLAGDARHVASRRRWSSQWPRHRAHGEHGCQHITGTPVPPQAATVSILAFGARRLPPDSSAPPAPTRRPTAGSHRRRSPGRAAIPAWPRWTPTGLATGASAAQRRSPARAERCGQRGLAGDPAVLASLAVDPILASCRRTPDSSAPPAPTPTAPPPDLTAGVTWSSSDPSVATVDANGLATGASAGTATLSPRAERCGPALGLQVTRLSSPHSPSTPSLASVPAGTTQQFRAPAPTTDRLHRRISPPASPGRAAIPAWPRGRNGLATGVSAGTATIIATSGAVQASAGLQVTPAVSPHSRRSILASVPPVAPNSSAATGTYTDGSTGRSHRRRHLVEQRSSVATVDANGLASGVSAARRRSPRNREPLWRWQGCSSVDAPRHQCVRASRILGARQGRLGNGEGI